MVAGTKGMAIRHVLVPTLVAGADFLDGRVRPRGRADSTFRGLVVHFDGALEKRGDNRVD